MEQRSLAETGEERRPKETKRQRLLAEMEVHIGVDAESGLTHPVVPTPANADDVIHAHALLYGDETDVSVTPVTMAPRSGTRIKAGW